MEKLVRNDKFKGVVIFATNNAQAFDSAALGRLLSVVPFVLPDESCRSRLFETHLPEDFPLSNKISYQELAELTDGFNGRDIKNVVQIAAIKTASRDDIPENLYGTMNDFQEAIDLVRQSYNYIR
ncbi:MAG: ATP-binding protein [Hormoscilla sp. SP5CHS1]|nr:ATP-binding protein [Hormoscilla sp. SP12CHS1]MBC6453755.1 ATP-binding protein [Hormoscilla sp. SP5CHS1]